MLLTMHMLTIHVYIQVTVQPSPSVCVCVVPLFVQLMDLKIFVDTDSDIRLTRRLRRDISDRGRDLDGVLKLYKKFVKPVGVCRCGCVVTGVIRLVSLQPMGSPVLLPPAGSPH